MRFKAGEWKEAKKVLFFDLEQLKDCEIKEDWDRAFKQLKGNLKDLYGQTKTPASNYKELKRLIEERCLETIDLLDVLPDEAIKDSLEYFSSHCNCGQPFKEGEDEIGFCGDCR